MDIGASLEPRALNSGTFYDSSNVCGTEPTTYYNLTLVANTTYRLRLINTGTFLPLRFSIDHHNLTVVEADGTAIQPVEVDGVTLLVAQVRIL